jgi:hypothetical protein
MSPDVKVNAGIAKGIGTAHPPNTRLSAEVEGHGPKRAEARKVERGGRPPAITSIADDEQLRAPIREMRRDRVRITQPTVAARSGFTIAEIRGYLRVTRRTWTDFLHSF